MPSKYEIALAERSQNITILKPLLMAILLNESLPVALTIFGILYLQANYTEEIKTHLYSVNLW
jgi:hypothetical protein